MLRAARFRIPQAHSDRAHPRQLAAIAAVCLSLGVALSGALRVTPQHQQAAAWRGAEAAPQPDPTLDRARARARDTTTETTINAASTPPAAIEPPSPNPDAEHKNTSKPKLVRGAVTYHCETKQHAACPRDPTLEARVWRVLSRLPGCEGAAEPLGRAELRLRFAESSPTRVVFSPLSPPQIAQSLNLRAVSKCVAPELSKLRPTRKIDQLELGFRFGLAGRK